MKVRMPKSTLGRVVLGLAAIIVVLLLGVGGMMMRMNQVPSDLDYATTRVSDQGIYKVTYTPQDGKVPVNQIHTWTLHVETADGQPVEGAQIAVDGDMPQHGHGLPTQPRVTQDLGNGNYRVEGMKFQMGGWWVMDFTINANGQQDAVHFNMQLQP